MNDLSVNPPEGFVVNGRIFPSQEEADDYRKLLEVCKEIDDFMADTYFHKGDPGYSFARSQILSFLGWRELQKVKTGTVCDH